jgi:hypothetical protein
MAMRSRPSWPAPHTNGTAARAATCGCVRRLHRVLVPGAEHHGGCAAKPLVPRARGPAYREDRSRSRETGGAGLGLSIVAAIVKAYGGRVEVESRSGEGTRFTVVLPALSEEPFGGPVLDSTPRPADQKAPRDGTSPNLAEESRRVGASAISRSAPQADGSRDGPRRLTDGQDDYRH